MKPFILILFGFVFLQADAQSDIKDLEPTDNRKKILLVSEASAYTLGLLVLNQQWYANYPKSKFHFINDNKEWMYMDKLGHVTTSYYMGVAGIKAYKWAGYSDNKAAWYGGLTGSLFLSVIEILDGHSAEWGASSGDLIANGLGSFLAIGQSLKWNEQRIQLKYSYSPTKWAAQNPNLLGSTVLQSALKDYNGQTYWLSFNISSLLNIETSTFPKWLNLSLGHSANGMTSGYEDGTQQRYRQYLLSFDVDLSKINTGNKVLNTVLHTFGFLKFPAPTLELSNEKWRVYPVYY